MILTVKEGFWPGKIFKLLTKILIAKHDVGNVCIDFQYQEMPPLVAASMYIKNSERKTLSLKGAQCHQDLLIYCSRMIYDLKRSENLK